jgi:uncharacterized membrane protein
VSEAKQQSALLERFDREAWRRIGLSALKAFLAAAVGVLITAQADLVSGDWTAVRGVIVAAVIAGLDAIAKAIQVYLESQPK